MINTDTSTVPTRLFALKYGATMVWGPEIVDKAMLHAKREVDRMLPIFFTLILSRSPVPLCQLLPE